MSERESNNLEDHASPEKVIVTPEYAHEIALSTKRLRDAAALLRSRAKESSAMDLGGFVVGSSDVKNAYKEKAAMLDRLADLLEEDVAGSIKLLESGVASSERRELLLMYELIKARVLSSAYAFFVHANELRPSDFEDYPALRRSYEDYLRKQEARRKQEAETFRRTYLPSVPLPASLLRLIGIESEDRKTPLAHLMQSRV